MVRELGFADEFKDVRRISVVRYRFRCGVLCASGACRYASMQTISSFGTQ